jgi:hypothetical protein
MIALQLFNLVLIVLQLWLFVSVLENILDGRYVMAIPAAAASSAILLFNIWILDGVYRLDAES